MLRISHEPQIAPRTTLRIGGRAILLASLEKPADAERLPGLSHDNGGEIRAIGGGSNILAADGVLPVILAEVRIGRTEKPLVRPAGNVEELAETGQLPPKAAAAHAEGDAGMVRLEVGAGTFLPSLQRFCTENGFAGIEGMCGIPGTVGGAVAGNAGSFGCDMNGVLLNATVFTPEDGIEKLGRQDFEIGYRRFAPLGSHEWFLILSCELLMPKAPAAKLAETAMRALAGKKASQPIFAKTAGCVFKNPAGDSAGRLLDAAGFKNRSRGGARFSPVHANFLENMDSARFADALSLIEEAENEVFGRFGTKLEREVRVWQ
ncbi:MAG: FAD-binding protein [Mailhella sp.]|nr:FAD-binding protein [Mailhella sp.]